MEPTALLEGLTTPYPKDPSAPSVLPRGYEFSYSPSSGTLQTTQLTITLAAWDGLIVRLKPATSRIEWESRGIVRTASLDVFTSWTISEADIRHVIVTLNNGVIVEAFSTGMVRFKNTGSKMTLIETTPDADSEDSVTHELNDDSWFLSSPDPWEILTKQVFADGDIAIYRTVSGREDWIAHLVARNNDDLLVGRTVIEKLARAMHMAYWALVESYLERITAETALETMSLDNLKLWGVNALGLNYRRNESVEGYRIRIKGEIANRVARPQFDAITALVASLTGTPESSVTIVENEADDGVSYEPMRIEVAYDLDALVALSLTEAQIAQVTDDLQVIINRVVGGGIKVVMDTTGGAQWDSGVWDEDLYGA